MTTSSYTMSVEFSINPDTQQIEVRTDGNLMGRYDDYEIAGRDLGDEFRHRIESSNP